MQSRITILGSGTCVPSLNRAPCSLLVQIKSDNLLFDCGPGIMRRLLEAGVSIFDISHIFISHFHPDHIGELASFLFAMKYPDPSPQQRPLTLIAGQGFASFFERLKGVYGNWIVLPPDRLKIIELNTQKPDQYQSASFCVSSAPVSHRPESLAYRIVDERDRSLVYSGDTDVCDNLVELARDADTMICESAHPDGQKVDGHLTPSLAGRIATQAGVKRLVLTHFYPACETVDIENQCRTTYNGSLILARDLMTLIL